MRLYGRSQSFSSSEFRVRAFLQETNMVQQDLFGRPSEEGTVIYTMTIRLKNGKVVRRANGRPFRIVLTKPKKS